MRTIFYLLPLIFAQQLYAADNDAFRIVSVGPEHDKHGYAIQLAVHPHYQEHVIEGQHEITYNNFVHRIAWLALACKKENASNIKSFISTLFAKRLPEGTSSQTYQETCRNFKKILFHNARLDEGIAKNVAFFVCTTHEKNKQPAFDLFAYFDGYELGNPGTYEPSFFGQYPEKQFRKISETEPLFFGHRLSYCWMGNDVTTKEITELMAQKDYQKAAERYNNHKKTVAMCTFNPAVYGLRYMDR